MKSSSLRSRWAAGVGMALGTACAVILAAVSLAPGHDAARAGIGRCDDQPVAVAAPAPATQPTQELNFLAMGDWGEGKPAQKTVAETMARYVTSRHARFAGLLTAGDNFYVPVSGTHDPVWQTLFEKMYDPIRLDFPFYVSLGNHDYDQKKYRWELAYSLEFPQSRWKLPSRWYRLDFPRENSLLTVMMLDSDHDFMTANDWRQEREFLEQQLARPRAPWTMCVAHHPLFSNGLVGQNGLLQKDWGELFKKYDVDLYLCGHDHNLQHLEIAGWKTSFVIAGGGGAHSAPIVRDSLGPFSRAVYGFAHFQFTPQQAIIRYVGADGQLLHEFVRSKAGQVRVTVTTPSDASIAKPLQVLQGIYDKIHPSTRPATRPGSETGDESYMPPAR